MGVKGRSIAITAVFLLILIGFAVAGLFNSDVSFSQNENRVLAQRPEWDFSGVISGKWTSAWESFATDQFTGRDAWVSLRSLLTLASGGRDVNGVYFGKNGFLLEQHDPARMDLPQLRRNEEAVRLFAQNAAKLPGIRSVRVLIAPTAQSVERAELPAFAPSFDEPALLSRLQAALPAGEFVDTYAALNNRREDYLYYRTDHHWTTAGALVAANEWLSSIGMPAVSGAKFETLSDAFYGTTWSKANLPGVQPDTVQRLVPDGGDPDVTVTYDGKRTETSLYSMARLSEKDKYEVFLDGNHVQVNIDVKNGGDRRLLVIKDSYAHAFVPLVASRFSHIDMIDLRYFHEKLGDYARKGG